MPTWTIRVSDDEDNIELISLYAETAAEAVRLAEVDLDRVVSIERLYGTGGRKLERFDMVVMALSMIAGSLYLIGVMVRSFDSGTSPLSEMDAADEKIPFVLMAIFAVGVFIAVLAVALRLVYRKNFAKRRKSIEAAACVNRTLLKHDSLAVLAQHPVMRMVELAATAGLGVYVISTIGTENPLEPFWFLLPLLVLSATSQPPFRERSAWGG